MSKKGLSLIKIILVIIITLSIMSLFFVLGRISRNNEVRNLKFQISKLKESTTSNKNTTDNFKTNSSNTTSKNTISEFELNERLIVSRSDGEYEITFEGVRETNDRNSFSDINPVKVIFIDYNYANISCEDDIFISSISYKVLDDNGNVLDTYPVSDDTRNNKSVPIGGKSKGCDAFAIMENTQKITILYYDYSNKPIGKLIVTL